jgi:hypothetical protein
MSIEPVSSYNPIVAAQRIGPSGDNEAAERTPDNEAAEISRKAPLAPYQGNVIDVQA